MSIGDRIKRAREHKGMTLTSVAAAARISKGFLSQIENGHARPSIDKLSALARALGVDAGSLLSEDSAPAIARAIATTEDTLSEHSIAGILGLFYEGRFCVLRLNGSELKQVAVRADSHGGVLFVSGGTVRCVTGRVEKLLRAGELQMVTPEESLVLSAAETVSATVLLISPGTAGFDMVPSRVERPSALATSLRAGGSPGPLRLVEMRTRRTAEQV